MAVAAVGVGWLAAWPRLVALGALFLTLGLPMWLLDVATGGEFLATSVLTHAGGLVLAVLGLRAFGVPRGVWWQGVLAMIALQQVSRWTTPPALNVNLAHRVHAGWEATFPSYPVYWALLFALHGAAFYLAEKAYARGFGGVPACAGS